MMMKADQVYELIRKRRLIAIVRGLDRELLVGTCRAILAGGLDLMEITANTDGVMEMIAQARAEMDEAMLIGAGTVTTPELAEEAIGAGAQYIVAPDLNPEVIEHCLSREIAVIPGAMTPSEVLTAHRLGAKIIKLFPAGSLGLSYVKDLRGPIDKIDLLAVGGIGPNNVAEYIRAGCLGAGMGSSLIKKDLVAKKDWDGLRRVVRDCLERIEGA